MNKLKLGNIALPPKCLENQVILITGAGSGIGRALALQAAKHGATIVLVGKTLKNLESVYDEIVTAGYPEPAIHPLNLLLTDPKQAAELAAGIKNLFGRLDGLVHNAGISGQICPIEHLPPENWQQVIQINLSVPFLLTRELLPLLKQSAQPSILFTTADESFQAKAYWSAYSASKFGIMGLAQALQEELENTHIRVNCINPGKVRTQLRLRAYPDILPEAFVHPDEIVPYYLYMLSAQAKEIRGQQVTL